MKKYSVASLLLALSWPLAVPAIAGNTGSIHGTAWLTSRWRPVVPSSTRLANVTVKVESSAALFVAQTNAQGRFAFLTLPPGNYEVRVYQNGFFALCYTAVVNADEDSIVDIGSQPFTGGSVTSSMAVCRKTNALQRGETADVYDIF